LGWKERPKKGANYFALKGEKKKRKTIFSRFVPRTKKNIFLNGGQEWPFCVTRGGVGYGPALVGKALPLPDTFAGAFGETNSKGKEEHFSLF